MAETPHPSTPDATAPLSDNFRIDDERQFEGGLSSDRGSVDDSPPLRQVLSELLSGNSVIPSKNRVKYGLVTIEDQSQDGVKGPRIQRYVEITKDNIGQGSGSVIRYFVHGGNSNRSATLSASTSTDEVPTSELDLVGSAVLHGCSFGPTKSPRGTFKYCIRIDFAKEFQPSLKPYDDVADAESRHFKSSRTSHKTPQKLVLCLASESDKKEWLQALAEAMRMTDQEQAATSFLLATLSHNTGKQFEQAVEKLVISEPGDDRIRELLSDILTQLMQPNAVSQSPQLVRDGLNCISTLVKRMPNKMRDRAALNMFLPAIITQTGNPSASVSHTAYEVLATAVSCCKEHILPFFYGVFQTVLRHIDCDDKEIRSKVCSLNEALLALTMIKNAKEIWRKTLDKHLEMIVASDFIEKKRQNHLLEASNLRREQRLQDSLPLSSIISTAPAAAAALTVAAASKLTLEFRFQWLEALIDKEHLDFFELGGSQMLSHAVVTLLDVACFDEWHVRSTAVAEMIRLIYSGHCSIRSSSSIGANDSDLAQVLVSKTAPESPLFSRNIAFMLVLNFFMVHPTSALPYYALFVRNVIVALPHSDIVPNARSVHEFMQRAVRGPLLMSANDFAPLFSLIEAVTSHLDVCEHSECSDTLQWISLFNELYPGKFGECSSTFLPPFMRLLVNCDGRNRLSGPHSTTNPSDEEQLMGCVPCAIDLFIALARQRNSCNELVQVLVDCLAELEPESVLRTTRLVVGSLFSGNQTNPGSLKPLELFTQLCVQLQLKKSQQHFCHLVSHVLVSLLFIKPELQSLRDLLSNFGLTSASVQFFDTCFKGFASNAVALIALSFYSRMYPLAAIVIHSFADWELSQSFESEVQYVVRLLQGTTMQCVRFDLHGGSGHEYRHQAWWALHALLAIMCVGPRSYAAPTRPCRSAADPPAVLKCANSLPHCRYVRNAQLWWIAGFVPFFSLYTSQLLLESCPLPAVGQSFDVGSSPLDATVSARREATSHLTQYLRDSQRTSSNGNVQAVS